MFCLSTRNKTYYNESSEPKGSFFLFLPTNFTFFAFFFRKTCVFQKKAVSLCEFYVRERNEVMQIAINPNIYGSAQIYAERKGLNLTTVIENFLVQFMSSAKEQTIEKKHREIEITPGAAWFEHSKPLNITDEEVDKIRYEHIMEKYK